MKARTDMKIAVSVPEICGQLLAWIRIRRQDTPQQAGQAVLDLLAEYVEVHAPDAYRDELEDHFSVTKIQPGKLWLEPFTTGDEVIGPLRVPAEVTQICRKGWDISGVVVKTSRGWRFLEVWNVTP